MSNPSPSFVSFAEEMPPSPEWAKYVRLRVVRNLTDIIRRWFRVEIAFADETGYVRAYEGGKIFDPTNAVCRMVLNTREGFRGCISSSRDTFQLVNTIRKPGDKLAPAPVPSVGADGRTRGPFAENRCHMNFRKIVVPVEVEGKVIGSVIAGGILPGGSDETVLADLVARGAKYGIEAGHIESAFANLPKVDELALQYLCELIAVVVREVAMFHIEGVEKDASIAKLTEELHGKYSFGAILGNSKPIRDMLSMLEKVVGSDSTVLVQGENGTGKELVARAVHANSPRAGKAFVMQSAAAFNENLLESELFGHMKGSFTGAIKDKRGLFEIADGGTFFLDEIGEMSPALQVKLLRVLQEGTFMPVGSTEPRKVDVRLVCATNRDLRRMVERGEFREDLYYRIHVINIVIPPLRDRRDDIPVLVKHFLKRLASERKSRVKEVSDEVLERFFDYEWPGNIRELENEVERLVVLSGDEMKIGTEHLSIRIKERSMRANVKGVRVDKSLDEILEEVERRVLSEGLRKTRWNKTQLAKQLGISRKGLIAKVQRYQLDRRKELR